MSADTFYLINLGLWIAALVGSTITNKASAKFELERDQYRAECALLRGELFAASGVSEERKADLCAAGFGYQPDRGREDAG